MVPLAEIALEKGFDVTGSEQTFSASTESLRRKGANIFLGHSSDHISDNVDIVVYSTAIPANNPELLAGKAANSEIMHRSDLLKDFMSERHSITVSGSHGKTSTTALIGHMLRELGEDPSIYVGGKTYPDNVSGTHGRGNLFVAEADESDGSFLKYHPYINIITSIRPDHLDYYTSFNNIQKTFQEYLSKTQKEGFAILFWDDPIIRSLALSSQISSLSYGQKIGCDVRLYQCKSEGKFTYFEAMVERERVKAKIPLSGTHNAINGLAALAVARVLSLDITRAADSFSSFQGVERRLSLIYESEKVLIYDDYSHNPDKISTALSALRESWRSHTIHVVFQPHRHSRMETLYNEIVESFNESNFVYVLPVYSAGENPKKAISLEEISNSIRTSSNVETIPCESFESAKANVLERLSHNAIIVSIGAGDVNKVIYEIKDDLERKKT